MAVVLKTLISTGAATRFPFDFLGAE